MNLKIIEKVALYNSNSISAYLIREYSLLEYPSNPTTTLPDPITLTFDDSSSTTLTYTTYRKTSSENWDKIISIDPTIKHKLVTTDALNDSYVYYLNFNDENWYYANFYKLITVNAIHDIPKTYITNHLKIFRDENNIQKYKFGNKPEGIFDNFYSFDGEPTTSTDALTVNNFADTLTSGIRFSKDYDFSDTFMTDRVFEDAYLSNQLVFSKTLTDKENYNPDKDNENKTVVRYNANYEQAYWIKKSGDVIDFYSPISSNSDKKYNMFQFYIYRDFIYNNETYHSVIAIRRVPWGSSTAYSDIGCDFIIAKKDNQSGYYVYVGNLSSYTSRELKAINGDRYILPNRNVNTITYNKEKVEYIDSPDISTFTVYGSEDNFETQLKLMEINIYFNDNRTVKEIDIKLYLTLLSDHTKTIIDEHKLNINDYEIYDSEKTYTNLDNVNYFDDNISLTSDSISDISEYSRAILNYPYTITKTYLNPDEPELIAISDDIKDKLLTTNALEDTYITDKLLFTETLTDNSENTEIYELIESEVPMTDYNETFNSIANACIMDGSGDWMMSPNNINEQYKTNDFYYLYKLSDDYFIAYLKNNYTMPNSGIDLDANYIYIYFDIKQVRYNTTNNTFEHYIWISDSGWAWDTISLTDGELVFENLGVNNAAMIVNFDNTINDNNKTTS